MKKVDADKILADPTSSPTAIAIAKVFLEGFEAGVESTVPQYKINGSDTRCRHDVWKGDHCYQCEREESV